MRLPRFLHAIIVLPTLLGLAPFCMARSWIVLEDGTGDAPSIQAAIDSSAAGDQVSVGPGTYYEHINFLGKAISVSSTTGSSATVIDGQGLPGSVVQFVTRETRQSVLRGFTITGGTGQGSPIAGGGVYIFSASPTIAENIFTMNAVTTSSSVGGAIVAIADDADLDDFSPLIVNNLFAQNSSARNGGAIALGGGYPEIIGNVFRDNECSFDGGAIWYVARAGQTRLEGNQFWDNHAGDHGGAVYAGNLVAAEGIQLSHSLFVRNRADGIGFGTTGSGGAVWIAGLSGAVFRNTIAFSTGSGEASCSGGAILLQDTPNSLTVRDNILANNGYCAIACFGTTDATMLPNVVWGHTVPVATNTLTCPSEWLDVLMVVDPMFCDPGIDNYSVSIDSPALSGPSIMGIWASPGCGPGVPIEPMSWGNLKVRFATQRHRQAPQMPQIHQRR